MLEFERTKFNRAVKESGLTKTELSLLFEVSRQQIYNLVAGAKPRSGIATRRANIYSSAICALIDKKVLPFPGAIVGTKRLWSIGKLKTKLYDLARP